MAMDSPRPQHHSDVQLVPAAPKSPFNPGWLSFALTLIVAIATVGATWRDVTDLRERMKAMETWKGAQEIAMTKLQKDVEHILDGIQIIQEQLNKLSPYNEAVPTTQPASYRNTGRAGR